MDFGEICRARFSARSFSERRVASETVNNILEQIRLAPTALNHQPYRVLVAESDEALQKLSEEAKAPLYGAKTVLVLCSDRSHGWSNRYSGESGILLDMGILTATALYAATACGVDSCCVCNFDPDALRTAFSLPTELTPDALILLGYRAPDCRPSDRHDLRREAPEFTDHI